MGKEKMPRRDALNYLLGAGIGALGVATLYPMVRYMIPPPASGAGTSSVSAAKVGELQPNQGKIFKFGNAPGIIILKPGGDPASALSYVAFTAVCTHLNCTVQYRGDLGEIWCACHNAHFDLNGQVISGPPPSPLKEYRVAIKGDEIFVSSEEA
ncbi:MAG: Rieske 2Fe-2S domain-containing protein [candidate division Zixibacteria bacterium]